MENNQPVSIEDWIENTINGSGGFKVMEDREIAVFKDRDVAIAEFVIRSLANPYCKGSKEVLEAINRHRDTNCTVINPKDIK